MRPSDREANAGAVFHPAVAAEANHGSYAPPCVEVGGVQVYVYVRDGIPVISLHYDTAETGPDSPFAVYDVACIPTVIDAGNRKPVWDALPDDAITEADARQLRKTGDARPGAWVLPDWVDGE
jgi:hypothetical protein